MNYSVNDYYAKSSKELDTNEIKVPIILINDVAKILFEKMKRPTDGVTQLTKSESIIMMYLSENPGVTQLEISKATHLQPPTVSIKLKKMEEDGYIKRITDNYDRRAVRVYLSEKGETVQKSSSENVSDEQKKLLEGISREEIATLTSILSKMIENSKK